MQVKYDVPLLNLVFGSTPKKLELHFSDSNDGHFSINSVQANDMVFKFYKALNVVKTGRIRVDTMDGTHCFLSVNARHELVCLKSAVEKGTFAITFYEKKGENVYFVSVGALMNNGKYLYINSEESARKEKVVVSEEECFLTLIETGNDFLLKPRIFNIGKNGCVYSENSRKIDAGSIISFTLVE